MILFCNYDKFLADKVTPWPDVSKISMMSFSLQVQEGSKIVGSQGDLPVMPFYNYTITVYTDNEIQI